MTKPLRASNPRKKIAWNTKKPAKQAGTPKAKANRTERTASYFSNRDKDYKEHCRYLDEDLELTNTLTFRERDID